MKNYILVLALILITMNAIGQNDSLKTSKYIQKEKHVFFNMTPFASQFVPFNAINPMTTGPVNIGIKKYSNNIAYRFGVGVNIGTFEENLHLNLRNGVEFRKKINNKFNYSHGCDALLSFGNLNLPGNTVDDAEVLVGVAPFWGIEYCFGKNISISTETSLLIGITSGGFGGSFRLQFIPPISLFLNLKR